MSVTTIEVERIITEYKELDIGSIRREHGDILTKLSDDCAAKISANTKEKNAEIDALQKLHGDHKNLQKDNTSAHHDRLKTLADVADENKKYGQFANDAAQEHSKLRDTIADKEHPLRVLRNEVAILGLENKNLQLVIDTEAALREAKGKAEIVAVTSVNKDLKDQTKRFEDDIKEERARKDDAHKILADLTKKHKEAEKALSDLLAQAQADRDALSKDNDAFRKSLIDKRASNEGLKGKVDTTNSSVAKLREAINQLNEDMNSLRTKNNGDIGRLEEERLASDEHIKQLRGKLTDADHDFNVLKIIVNKTRGEIEFLNSEKDKHQSQHYQKKLDDFQNRILSSEAKSKELADELARIGKDWRERLEKVTRETENTIRSNEHDSHLRKVELLLQALDIKNRELEELQKRKAELEKVVSGETSDSKDKAIDDARKELEQVNAKLLDTLNEKNGMYDQLSKNTRELLDIDNTIQRNSQEIARLVQEFGILRKELEQKDKIIYDLRIILERLRSEIAQLKQLIEELEKTLSERDAEVERLRALAAEKEDYIKELERQLAEMRAKPPTPEPIVEEKIEPLIEIQDDVDAMLAQYISGCPVPIKRLGGGYYMFGTKKIYAKIMNGKLVIRVGGGYMNIEEFIKTYADQELIKVNKRRQQGLDIFTGKPLSEMAASKSPKGTRSPKASKSPKYIDGTDAPTQLTADDIKKYKEN